MSSPRLDGTQLRAVRDEDRDGLTALVTAAYQEHPGCVLDPDGVDADLQAPATTAAAGGGRWWILERDGEVVASIGAGTLGPDGTLELKRLYLSADLRGRGLATRLISRVEAHATALGAWQVELWSDSRFTAAHRRYATLGYRDTGERRRLHDPSDTTELRFCKDLPQGVDPDPTPVRWDGPHGIDEVVARALPDGSVLRGTVGQHGYCVEVDHAWRPRRIELTSPTARLLLTSDGQGRWWRDGQPEERLAGCTDPGLSLTPAAVQVAVRRLGLGTGDSAEVRLAVLPHPVGEPYPLQARFDRAGVHSYRHHLDGEVVDIEVDRFGLPVSVGTRWRRVEEPAETAGPVAAGS